MRNLKIVKDEKWQSLTYKEEEEKMLDFIRKLVKEEEGQGLARKSHEELLS